MTLSPEAIIGLFLAPFILALLAHIIIRLWYEW
jgi:hypothetical protein